MTLFASPLVFITDPGHSWLRVPLPDFAILGIEAEISSYSFIDTGSGVVYLEEDCDYDRFVTACNAQGVTLPEIQVHSVAAFNRSLPRFGSAQFSSVFWNRVRIAAQSRQAETAVVPWGSAQPGDVVGTSAAGLFRVVIRKLRPKWRAKLLQRHIPKAQVWIDTAHTWAVVIAVKEDMPDR